MAEKSRVFKQVIKHKGVFSFKELYDFCYQWLDDERYFISEDIYTEKVESIGKQLIIEWTAQKKVTDYFKNIIKIKWHIIGLNDVEAERNGKKVKSNNGELKLTIAADLEKDYEEKWSGRPFNKFLRAIYDKYIIRTTTEEYEDRLIGKADTFFKEVKSFLNLEG